MAADSYEVTTLDDEDDADTSDLNDLSLREAIRLANADPSASKITFAPNLTSGGAVQVTLSSNQLDIASDLTISGPTAEKLAIDANGASRIFHVASGTVELFGLTLRNGSAETGAGILNGGNLTIQDSVITGNQASFFGGGIYSTPAATLTIQRSTVSGNTAGGRGAALYIYGEATVIDSTLSNNAASGPTGSSGGAASVGANSTLTVINSTVSGNSVNSEDSEAENPSSNGGAFCIQSSSALHLLQSTVTNNWVTGDREGDAGGGIYVYNSDDSQAAVTLTNSIVSGNYRGANNTTPDDISGLGTIGNIAANYSLIGITSGVEISGSNNLNGDPKFGPLADNGGPTKTHALLSGSPAIDAADSVEGAQAGDFDQRGDGFPRFFGNGIDIGAFELSAEADTAAPTVIVTPDSGITKASPITFTFQFSEEVTNFDASDITLTNGIKGVFSAIDGDTYTLDVTPTADGTVTANVAANSAQDAAANGNVAGSGSITSDRTPPVLEITPVFAQSNANTLTFTFQFSEAVSGFAKSDIAVTNGTAGTFTPVDSDTYTLTVAPTADGTVGISVANNAARDTASNGSKAATAAVISDRTSPTVAIGNPSLAKTQLGPISFPVTFTDTKFDKSTLTASDVTLNSTGTATGTISVSAGTGATRTVTINNISGVGTLGISIKSGAARDKAGNLSTASSASISVQVVLGITVTRDADGNLQITDTKTTDTNDSLTITADNSARAYVVNEPTAFVSSTVPGAIVVDDHTVRIPYSKVIGPNVVINGNLGDDSIIMKGANLGAALTKSFVINGGAGRDAVTLEGSLLTRFTGGVAIDGGTEDDALSAAAIVGTGSFSVTLAGAAGNDSLSGGDGNDVIRGGAGEDVLVGGNVNYSLFGQGGVDALTGGLGHDSIDGGASADRLIEAADSNLTLTTTALSGLGTDVLTAIETASLDGGVNANRLDASGFTGDVILRGNAGNDTLIGGVGADILRGGDGDDLLTGGAGNDQFIGNLGTDTVSETGSVNFTVSSGAQADPNLPDSTLVGLGTDGLLSIEIVKLTGGNGANRFDASTFNGRVSLDGGSGNDTLIGTAFNDTLIGGAGDDQLMANAGSDSMEGNAGNDSLTGGLGRDTLEGGAGTDTLDGGSGHVDTIRYEIIDTVIGDAFDFLIQL